VFCGEWRVGKFRFLAVLQATDSRNWRNPNISEHDDFFEEFYKNYQLSRSAESAGGQRNRIVPNRVLLAEPGNRSVFQIFLQKRSFEGKESPIFVDI
jgi:hypothetical protein